METAIGLVTGSVALVGALLQLTLLLQGLYVGGRLLFPSRLKRKPFGLFGLWGGWHLVVFILITKLGRDEYSAAMGRYQEVASQLEGLEILSVYLVLPLVTSFIISRTHLYARSRFSDAV